MPWRGRDANDFPSIVTPPQPILRADWERQVSTLFWFVPFDTGGPGPEYWQIFFRFAPAGVLLDLVQQKGYANPQGKPAQVDPSKFLIDITFKAALSILEPANINSTGIVCAQLVHAIGGIFSNPSQSPASNGLIIPTLYTPANTSSNLKTQLDEAAFDSTALPIGGVTYPIWTQSSVTLRTRMYATDAFNPGNTWAIVYPQVAANLNTNTGVALQMTFFWEPVEEP